MPDEPSRPLRERRGPRSLLGWLAGAAWIAVVAAGFARLVAYESGPGAMHTAPARWPGADGASLDATRMTLVLFAHPHCPCTRASLAQLDQLLARAGGRIAANVRFYADPALGDGWERSASWERAAAIPGVAVAADPLGTTARVFAAATSGHVVVYAPDGALRFYGGITSARGHEGDSAGVARILELLGRPDSAVASAPVYGCALAGSREAAR